MKCANCGTENQPEAAFCIHCGAKFDDALPAESAAAGSPMPVGAGDVAAVGAGDSAAGTTPVTAAPPSSPPAAPRPSGPTADDMMANLQNATTRLEAAAQPYQQRLAPIQNALRPLEGIGKQMLAWIGCALVLIGLFVPIKTYSIAFVQISYNYWNLNSFLSIIFLILLIAAAALAYLRMYIWLWLIGAFFLLFFLLGFINAFSGGGDISSDSGAITPHASYGWIFLFAGTLAILAAAAMRDTGRSFSR